MLKLRYPICGRITNNQVIQSRRTVETAYMEMCDKPKNFKLSLKRCKKSEDRRANDILTMPLEEKSFQKLWTRVKQYDKTDSQQLAQQVDGVNGHRSVCELWRSVYRQVLNEKSEKN
ncbi:unnamed protein product [Orchesella dallaii]|uniref:Uncharacterized protein n=1 Tax=Orchesella dallaii TaxID=48710 RepID=A0ABP1S0N3_9HEXA